eukprot:c47764_g1_i1.p1 GENE.c47764_g1_i1~~c47764_g1_i1.p1  ORF type:complete len:346 (+),score=34.78 c47764_g1_i1:154-1191(+)
MAASRARKGSRLTLAAQVLPEPTWQDPRDYPLPAAPPSTVRTVATDIPGPEGVIAVRLETAAFGDPVPETGTNGELLYKCSVCDEDKPRARFHALEGCSHAPLCAVCVGRGAAAELNIKGRTTIRCSKSHEGCAALIQPEDIQRCSAAEYERFCRLTTMHMLAADPSFVSCTNTRNGCGAGQLNDSDGGGNISRCYNCRWATCVEHNIGMHFGLTCAQYDTWQDALRNASEVSRSDGVALNEELIESRTRPCPGRDGVACGVPVSKEGTFEGDRAEECHHMTCARCDAEWCWLCSGPFYGGDPSRRARPAPMCTDADHLVRYRTTYRRVAGQLMHCHHQPGCINA